MTLSTGARHAVIVKTTFNRYSIGLAVIGTALLHASSLVDVDVLRVTLHALGFGALYFDYHLTKRLIAENIEFAEREDISR